MAKETDGPRRGRPRSEEPGISVSMWLKSSEHDRVIELAKKHEASVSETLRHIVVRTLGDR